MVNIGEISKPNVDPAFVKKSRAGRKARQTAKVEAGSAASPVDETQDLLSLSSEAVAREKNKQKTKAVKPELKKDKSPKKIEDKAQRPDEAPDHIDISV